MHIGHGVKLRSYLPTPFVDFFIRKYCGPSEEEMWQFPVQAGREGLKDSAVLFPNPARTHKEIIILSTFTVMHTLQSILQKLREYKPELQKKYPVSELGVFGSYARGEATENSDIDIAVVITGPMGLSFVAMADEIESLFGTKTDVVPLRSIKPRYLASVQKDIVYA